MSGGNAAGAVKPVEPVVLAVVTRAHGLKGELAIHRFNPDSASLVAGGLVWVEGQHVAGRWVRVNAVRGDWLALEGVSDRTQAESLRGVELSVERTSLPQAAPGEFYLHDLLGFEVFDSTGRRLGTLAGLQVSGTREYFVIQGAGDVWLPADAPIVGAVDLEAARMHLNIEVEPDGPVDGPEPDGPDGGPGSKA